MPGVERLAGPNQAPRRGSAAAPNPTRRPRRTPLRLGPRARVRLPLKGGGGRVAGAEGAPSISGVDGWRAMISSVALRRLRYRGWQAR